MVEQSRTECKHACTSLDDQPSTRANENDSSVTSIRWETYFHWNRHSVVVFVLFSFVTSNAEELSCISQETSNSLDEHRWETKLNLSFVFLPCRYVCQHCEDVCLNLTRRDVKWWFSPRQRQRHLCIARRRQFHLLRPLCWHIQLETRDRPVKIVMHLNRTKKRQDDIFERQNFSSLTPEPIDDIVSLSCEGWRLNQIWKVMF